MLRLPEPSRVSRWSPTAVICCATARTTYAHPATKSSNLPRRRTPPSLPLPPSPPLPRHPPPSDPTYPNSTESTGHPVPGQQAQKSHQPHLRHPISPNPIGIMLLRRCEVHRLLKPTVINEVKYHRSVRLLNRVLRQEAMIPDH